MNTITMHQSMKWEDFTNSTVDRPSENAWKWCMDNRDGDIHILDQYHLLEHVNYNGKIKIAMFGEVPAIYDYAKQFDPFDTWIHPYKWFENNHHHFDYVMSHFTFLKDIVGEKKFIWTHVNYSFIRREERGIYEKERLLSIMASSKRMTPGHMMRHEAIAKYGKFMDVYGDGYNNIIKEYHNKSKIIALAPYYFHIVILNTNIDDWFDAQTTDAMAVGTIPIFCGTKNIVKYFNPDGIIQFNTIDELGKIIPTLNKELYESKINAVLENMEEVNRKEYTSTEEWLYVNKKEFLENLKK